MEKPLATPSNKSKTYTTRSGKVLYGGGGIMPDIYIPVDTTGYTDLYYELTAKGVLNDVLYNHLLKQNQVYQSTNELIKNFRLSDQDIKKLIHMAAKRNVRQKKLR